MGNATKNLVVWLHLLQSSEIVGRKHNSFLRGHIVPYASVGKSIRRTVTFTVNRTLQNAALLRLRRRMKGLKLERNSTLIVDIGHSPVPRVFNESSFLQRRPYRPRESNGL